jgi:hypothetical protein
MDWLSSERWAVVQSGASAWSPASTVEVLESAVTYSEFLEKFPEIPAMAATSSAT